MNAKILKLVVSSSTVTFHNERPAVTMIERMNGKQTAQIPENHFVISTIYCLQTVRKSASFPAREERYTDPLFFNRFIIVGQVF